MTIQLVFETHAISEDNERGVATGWRHGHLSAAGREQARALGERRRRDGIRAVFTSDLHRATETATIAFAETRIPVLCDWRLRECDYGRLNGAPRGRVHDDRLRYLDEPYPDGESWRQAVRRVGRFLDDLPLRWSRRRVLVIGHVATHVAFDHLLAGMPLEDLLGATVTWQKGWEYRLG